MDYDADERRGRALLLALLGLNLLLKVVEEGYTLWRILEISPALGPYLVIRPVVGLLPLAVVLWAIFRGSWPGLALLCITVVSGVGNLIGVFQFGGAQALNSQTALSLVQLLAQGTLLLAIFQHDQVSRYWRGRQLRRRRRDLVLEIVLFVASLALNAFGIMLL